MTNNLNINDTINNDSNETQIEKPLNWYERKQLDRKYRYEALADLKEEQSEQAFDSSRNITKDIPLGQPILIGHHSEKSHRNLINRSNNKMAQSVKLSNTAEYYSQKAQSVGKGGISSDDPDAIQKLETELEKLQEVQDLMKKANRIIKSKKKDYTQNEKISDLINIGIKEKIAIQLFEPDFCGRIGFADYKLTNNNANIKRIIQRIESLRKLQNRVEVNNDYGFFEYNEDKDENRILFIFPNKPSEEVRSIIKSYAFKYSPTRSAWVRKITVNALYDANQLRQKLLKFYEENKGL